MPDLQHTVCHETNALAEAFSINLFSSEAVYTLSVRQFWTAGSRNESAEIATVLLRFRRTIPFRTFAESLLKIHFQKAFSRLNV